jgi:hypothetical protein
MAASNELGMRFRVALRDSHGGVPAIGDCRQVRIELAAQLRDRPGKRVAEVLVLAAPETVPRHHHSAAKEFVGRVKGREALTFGRAQQPFNHGAAASV